MKSEQLPCFVSADSNAHVQKTPKNLQSSRGIFVDHAASMDQSSFALLHQLCTYKYPRGGSQILHHYLSKLLKSNYKTT